MKAFHTIAIPQTLILSGASWKNNLREGNPP